MSRAISARTAGDPPQHSATSELADGVPHAGAGSGGPRPPVLRVTRYDVVTSLLIALALSLIISVGWLFGVWWAIQPPRAVEDVPLELVEMPGGEEEGAVGETLLLEAPAELREDPASVDDPADEPEIAEMLETVLELSDEASELARQQLETDARNAGRLGSAAGTGRRALGSGPGEQGVPREQRWFVGFPERATVDAYARQLDHFGIELGALFSDGRLVYLSQLTQAPPQTRTVQSGQEETRLYFTWQGGSRRVADLLLFQRAGIDAAGATILHFYPPATEATLARLERAYREAPVESIRRTYFAVAQAQNGWQFVVTRQTSY